MAVTRAPAMSVDLSARSFVSTVMWRMNVAAPPVIARTTVMMTTGVKCSVPAKRCLARGTKSTAPEGRRRTKGAN